MKYLSFFIYMLGALAALVVFESYAFALTKLYEVKGDSMGSFLGAEVVQMGDINGDGVADFAASAPLDPGGSVREGMVRVYSGADGTTIYTLFGSHTKDEWFGIALAVIGDVNNDGLADLAVGSHYDLSPAQLFVGRVYVFSGSDGSPIHVLTGTQAVGYYGSAIAAMDDLDNDDVADFLVGESGAGPSWEGAVHFISGANGNTLFSKKSPNANEQFGKAVCNLGDINGDGVSDYAVGADGAKSNVGSAYIYSGSTGAQLSRFDGMEQGANYGHSIQAVGDVNGDGVPDMAIHAPGTSATKYKNGYVEIRSGNDNKLLHLWTGSVQGSGHGYNVVNIGDLDKDGLSDLAVSEESRDAKHPVTGFLINPGRVELYSTATGKPITTLDGADYDRLGSGLAAADLNSDGEPELIIGARQDSTLGQGRVLVYNLYDAQPPGATPTPTPSPTATPGATPIPDSTLSAQLSSDGQLTLTVNHSNPSGCTFRLRAAASQTKLNAGKGKFLIGFNATDSSDEFVAKRLPKIKGKKRALWLALDKQKQCSSGGWELLDAKEVNFQSIAGKRRPRRARRIIKLLLKLLNVV